MEDADKQRLLRNIQDVQTSLSAILGRARTLPLEALPGLYRDGAEQWREVQFKRRAACVCPKGCETCSFLRWVVEPEKIRVKIPAGATVGTCLRLPGKGDYLIARDADLMLEIVGPGERAEKLAELARAHDDDLEDTWRRESARARRERRERRRTIVGGVVMIVFLGLVVGVQANRRAPLPRYQPVAVRSVEPIPMLPTLAPTNDELVELPVPTHHRAELLPVATAMPAPDDPEMTFLSNGLVRSMPAALAVARTDFASVRRGAEVRGICAMPRDPLARGTGEPFWLRQMSTKQTPTPSAPWHATGGQWTFIEAQVGSARVLVGMTTKSKPSSSMPSYESGEAIFVSDAPGARPRKGRIGVFGRALHRSARTGAYEEADTPGRWTCAKLTLDEPSDSSLEVYLAFDPTERVGEFMPKDAETSAAVAGMLTKH